MIVPLSAVVVVTGVAQNVVAELLATPESGGSVGRLVYMTPGAMSWDTCDCSGTFMQTITRKNPTEVFPVDSSNNPNKGGCQDRSMMWNVQAVILRCVHGLREGPGGKVLFPKPVDLLADSIKQQGDEYALRKGVTCFLQDLKSTYRITDYRVAGSDFVGPEGNCGGVLISYSFQLV